MLENDELEEVNIKGRKLGQRLNKLEAVLPLKIKIRFTGSHTHGQLEVLVKNLVSLNF